LRAVPRTPIELLFATSVDVHCKPRSDANVSASAQAKFGVHVTPGNAGAQRENFEAIEK